MWNMFPKIHCVKNVRIWSYSCPYLPAFGQNTERYCVKSFLIPSHSGPNFPAFGLNMEGYSVSLRIQFESGKVQTRKTPNTDTFHAVLYAAGKLKANCCL